MSIISSLRLIVSTLSEKKVQKLSGWNPFKRYPFGPYLALKAVLPLPIRRVRSLRRAPTPGGGGHHPSCSKKKELTIPASAAAREHQENKKKKIKDENEARASLSARLHS